MKKMFNNKIVFITLFSVFLLLLTSVNCFASSKDFIISDNLTITCPNYDSNKPDYFLFSCSGEVGNYYYLLTWKGSTSQLVHNDNDKGQFTLIDNNGSKFNGLNVYKVSKKRPSNGFELVYENVSYFQWGNSNIDLVYTTEDIFLANGDCLTDNNFSVTDTLVFQSPLVPAVGEVAPKLEEVEMSKILEEILGILPLIIALLACFLGFRKGLKVLLNILRKG